MIISDLAFESAGNLKTGKGFKNKITNLQFDIEKSDIQILSESASKTIGKDIGKYVCLNFTEVALFSLEIKKYLTKQLVNVVTSFLKPIKQNSKKSSNKKILVVGLGNEDFIADSLGSAVIDKVICTIALKQFKVPLSCKLNEVYCFNCGVFATTGVESALHIKCLSEIINPDVIVIIDSFVANSPQRLGKSIQVCDAGLIPGGGLYSGRKPISQKFLNVPVIVIGVPLITRAGSLVSDNELSKLIDKKTDNLVLTPKNIEDYVHFNAKVISKALNISLNSEISSRELENFL